MRARRFFDVEQRGPAAVVTIKNPPRNFLTTEMLRELSSIHSEALRDSAVRALIITGGVDGYFVAHADLAHLVDLEPKRLQARWGRHLWQEAFNQLQFGPLPVIAAINGQAWGGGCELALACDYRFMARGSWTIGLFEVDIGVIPAAGGTQRIVRLLGRGRATELLLEGKRVPADEAEAIGLIHQAVDPPDLLSVALERAQSLAEKSPVAIAQLKRLINEGANLPFEQGLRLEQDAFVACLAANDVPRRLMQEWIDRYGAEDAQRQ